ncbi:hypothetical protein NliqN6_6153 [Naganishia liquefaciens]|uniref:Uncharacterized protein n=1 Tax=Naganishia liquefaciens TaxID=104408 RepID=A0A8H3TZI3_9TREE|nr:hypothetical protein NliqN6_6153 [Naganishia liquefaciens]
MQISHASVNLPRLVKGLSARSSHLESEDWVQVRAGQATIEYARGLLKLVREENVVPAGKVNTLERELNNVAHAFEEAVKRKPIPSSSTTPPPSIPPIAIPSSLIVQQSIVPSNQALKETPLSSGSDSTFLEPNLETMPQRSPIREASTSLPALTTRESFLAEKEDEALLPLRPAEEDQRGELFGGLARGDRRGLRGAAQLHDEIGGQLAEMSHQLKLNAVHFSKSLEDEKGILEASTEVLTRNLDRTQVSKKVLDSVRKKAGGTTWLTIISIVVVMIAFVWTYLLIRFT